MASDRYRDTPWQALVMIALLLPGCMVGPDFTRPPAKVSQTWLEAADQRVKTESTEYRTWWRAFDDPVLDQLIARAYRENLSLKIAGVRLHSHGASERMSAEGPTSLQVRCG
jgi:outer membrane protein TolC